MSNAERNAVTQGFDNASPNAPVTLPEEGRRKKEELTTPLAESFHSETPHPQTPSPKEEGALQAEECSRCKAKPGEPCVDRRGAARADHAARSKGVDPEPVLSPRDKNRAFEQQGREWAEKHIPDLPLIFVFAAWCVEKYVAQGEPEVAKVRRRVELRMERIAAEEAAV